MTCPLTVGTAGHIDHGKTALVKALTGRDTDRLEEERRRGISIELGFAELDLGMRRLSLVDVPGHERFVRMMIAGASGVDLFLMVVAADDGVMPQTREHAAVLRALGIDIGVIALAKSDLVDEGLRTRAADQARELLPAVPLIEVSSRTGKGLDTLRVALAAVAEQAEQRAKNRGLGAAEPVVLHVDRVFTIPGHGTVVTGTLWSGTVSRGDRVTVLPYDREVRVRSVQVHDRSHESAEPRQRVALNLAGLRRDEVRRGDVVASVGSKLRPTYRLDVELSLSSEDLADHERVQVHHGTREAPARIVQLGEGMAQLRLEAPLIAREGDGFVIRRIAPADTLGGGTVLDARPRRHGPDLLADCSQGPGEVAGDAASHAMEAGSDRSDPGGEEVESADRSRGRLAPGSLGLKTMEILRTDGAMPRGPGALAVALDVGRAEALEALDSLLERGDLIRVKPGIYYPAPELETLTGQAIAFAEPTGGITVAELRDALGISRKYSLALLEYLDSRKITIRLGDQHELRRRRTPNLT